MRAGRHALAAVTLLAALSGGSAPAAFATHGGTVTGIVIDFTGLRSATVSPGGEGCVVSGVVHNGSDRRVTVRVRYRGQGAGGSVALADARIPDVQPGETREFASSAFSALPAGTPPECAAIRHVEMIEAVADPDP